MSKRIVVVTGGKRGIGVAIVEAFLGQGCQVLALDRDFPPGLVRSEENDNLYTYRGDVSQPVEIQAFVEALQEDFGRVDVLVNNAGIGIFKPLDELEIEEWDQVLNTNLRGPFLTTFAAST